MTVVVGLLIGNETWSLFERSLRSLRSLHPDQDVIVYYSLDPSDQDSLKTLTELDIEIIDIGRPGLMDFFSATSYSSYNTTEFNIKTSFKWLALLSAMTTRLDHVIFIDADIKIISPLPFSVFDDIWEHFDIFVQDEGNAILPKHPCTGFLGLKFCEANVALLETLHKEQCAAIVSSQSKHDQGIFYETISRDIALYKKVYFLPQLLFPVGYLGPIYNRFDRNKITLLSPVDPVIYHANWVVGLEAKTALMDGFSGPGPVDQPSVNGLINYQVGRFEIQLPADHLLPVYQANHLRYDRFLSHLAQALPPGSAIVDVGANCGDTLAAMASSNSDLEYVCIEADASFFSLLEANIKTIKHQAPGLQVKAVCELIGKEIGSAILVGQGGTKQSLAHGGAEGGLQSKSLDSVLADALDSEAAIALLKTDTDGWDFDVIFSASQMIERQMPLIFFECQHGQPHQLEGFGRMIDWLTSIGYSSWFVFDNYGEFMLELASPEAITSLMSYINRQNLKLTTRTVYYLDILAASPAHHGLASSALCSYLA